jgi:hypothetical protein
MDLSIIVPKRVSDSPCRSISRDLVRTVHLRPVGSGAGEHDEVFCGVGVFNYDAGFFEDCCYVDTDFLYFSYGVLMAGDVGCLFDF